VTQKGPSVLRFDVTTNDWVIFAPSRSLRPDDFVNRPNAAPQRDDRFCPFCPGNESLTPPEVFAIRDSGPPNSPGWKVRVMPNKFPALRIEEDYHRGQDGRLFRHMGGCGAHEVIVDSPSHTLTLAQQPVEQVRLVLWTLQQRYIDLMRDTRFQTIVIFKNHGEGAGTSLIHPHCQLIAASVVPHMLRHKLAVAAQYFDQTGECVYAAMLQEELAAKERILAANDHFVALLPYASQVPFETWILPRRRQSSFRWLDPSLLRPLAELLKNVLLRLFVGLADPHFNLTIDTVPRGEEDAEYFLWHIQILPRLTKRAGFEMGSGMSINTVLPEQAAALLREVKLDAVRSE
jgi:UDPglucose--hexose-1-phosphate uridylyltransferase